DQTLPFLGVLDARELADLLRQRTDARVLVRHRRREFEALLPELDRRLLVDTTQLRESLVHRARVLLTATEQSHETPPFLRGREFFRALAIPRLPDLTVDR